MQILAKAQMKCEDKGKPLGKGLPTKDQFVYSIQRKVVPKIHLGLLPVLLPQAFSSNAWNLKTSNL